MNVYGNDTVSQNRKVCLWTYYDTKAQNFQIRADGNYLKIVSTINTNYALNAWRKTDPYGCDVYPYAGNEKDARIQLEEVNAAKNLYKIKLLNYSKYLTAPAVKKNNGVINWSAKFTDSSAAQRQIWKLTTSGINLAAPAVHNGGHIISYAGKGGCLNIYGNEVISPNRRVCIWSWDEKNAQIWKLGSVGGKIKIFSTLDYPKYALNIYRNGTNACDVYPHTGNDGDSEIIYEPIDNSGRLFRFYLKPLTSNILDRLYLTAAGKGNNSNVFWATLTNSDSQIWEITTIKPESTIVPGTPIDGADSTLVTEIVPSHSYRYRDRENTKISEITVHHMGGIQTALKQGETWSTSAGKSDSDFVSSHYGIKDDSIVQYVNEENAANTNGVWEANNRAVTIEVSNDSLYGQWPISDKSFNSLVKLVADIARRNQLEKLTLGIAKTGPYDRLPQGGLPNGNLTWHSMYKATTCPGDYIRSRLQDICDEANKKNGY